jgi:ornithine cyclodeaminase/alanine dehydrogenase-like protein (mu-crystallin family)
VSIRFRLLTEADVTAVLTMDDLIETMTSALHRFSTGRVVQPVRPTIPIADDSFFATMPAYVLGESGIRSGSDPGLTPKVSAAALGAKLVTVFGGNAAQGLHSHLATIMLLNPETGALLALLDGRYITEARTAAVSAVSSRLLARKTAQSVAILGTGVQARSHLDALSRVHRLRQVTVWSPNKLHRERFVEDAINAQRVRSGSDPGLTPAYTVSAVDHAGEAVVGADIVVLVTSSPTPVLENGWVKPGAHVISVGACRPTQREMDPALVARARLFVDSRAAALVESGDVVMGIQEGRFGADHIVAELGELIADDTRAGRRNDTDVTIFKSLGLAVEDVTAAELAYRRAEERGIGQELDL